MKRWIVVYLISGFAFATAQTAAPPTSPAADSASETAPSEPAITTSPDNTRYVANPDLLTACEARLSAQNGKPCNILFIGDSATARWQKAGKATWDKSYEPRRAFNFGVEGDKIQNVLWRLNSLPVQSLSPKVVVLMIGTNNTVNSAHEIADGIKAIIVTLQSYFPGVKIILVSILPNEHAPDKMKQADSLLRNLADENNVHYFDLVSKFPSSGAPGVSAVGIGSDHLNPDPKGYQIWADSMEPMLSKLLGTAK